MNISLSIEFEQLKNIIGQCDMNEKLELFHFLEKQTFANRFNQFLADVKTDELSLEEITAEVEAVRQARYNAQ